MQRHEGDVSGGQAGVPCFDPENMTEKKYFRELNFLSVFGAMQVIRANKTKKVSQEVAVLAATSAFMGTFSMDSNSDIVNKVMLLLSYANELEAQKAASAVPSTVL